MNDSYEVQVLWPGGKEWEPKFWCGHIQEAERLASPYRTARIVRRVYSVEASVVWQSPDQSPIPIQLCGGPEYIREHGIAGLEPQEQGEEADND